MRLKKILKKLSDACGSKAVRVCLTVTAALLAVAFVSITAVRSRLPVMLISTDGLSAKTPAEAQTMLRTRAEEFAKLRDEHPDCVFVWCGSGKLYLVRSDKLQHINNDDFDSFDRVRIYNSNGLRVRGYVIDPCVSSRELGRIELVDADKLSADSVAMSVRIGLRNGDIDYGDAVYLWERGSTEVIVLKSGAVDASAGEKVSYTDDGEVLHECVVLDTKLD